MSIRKRSNLLTLLVAIGLVLGVVVGHFLLWDPNASAEVVAGRTAGWKTAGEFIFIRPLQLLIIPLVFTSVLTGITSIGDPKRLGVLGGATLVYYVVTMIFAVAIGVTFGAVFQPGVGLPNEVIEQGLQAGQEAAQRAPAGSAAQGLGAAWLNILRQMIPTNFFQAAVEGQALSIITATMLLGVGLVALGQKNRAFVEAVESLHEALMLIVQWVLWLMPIGVALLVAWAVGSVGLPTLGRTLAKYVVVVLAGLALHMFGVLPAVLWLLGRVNPFKYMWAMKPALLTAFGTSSSMATLPVTIETSVEAGASKRSAGLVLPLGATVNMDGTALYQGATVIFLFQAFGYDLHFSEYLVIVLTATLAAVGAAGVPGGSLATIMIIISAVNTTMQGREGFSPLPFAAVGLYLPVDRFLDMCRTMVNVWGDSCGARIITRLAPDIEEAKEEAFA